MSIDMIGAGQSVVTPLTTIVSGSAVVTIVSVGAPAPTTVTVTAPAGPQVTVAAACAWPASTSASTIVASPASETRLIRRHLRPRSAAPPDRCPPRHDCRRPP